MTAYNWQHEGEAFGRSIYRDDSVHPKTASPARLKDGSWGVKVWHESVRVGEEVEVVDRKGRTWGFKVERVLWRGIDQRWDCAACLCAGERVP